MSTDVTRRPADLARNQPAQLVRVTTPTPNAINPALATLLAAAGTVWTVGHDDPHAWVSFALTLFLAGLTAVDIVRAQP